MRRFPSENAAFGCRIYYVCAKSEQGLKKFQSVFCNDERNNEWNLCCGSHTAIELTDCCCFFSFFLISKRSVCSLFSFFLVE